MKLLTDDNLLKKGLLESNLSPHNYQIAVAFYACWKAIKCKKSNSNISFEVGPGMGKSRIIMCLALILVSKYKDFNVAIIFSNDQLSIRDKEDFNFIFISSDVIHRINYYNVT